MWWLVSAVFACEQPIPTSALNTLMSDFEGAFARRDADRLDSTHTALMDTLPCLDEEILPDVAARFHRVQGMVAFLDDERQQAAAAFRAARALDPGHTLSIGLVDTTHPMRALYEGLKPTLTTSVLPAPANGWLTIDGRRTHDRPDGVAAIIQHLDATGTPLFTTYVGAFSPPPPYPIASASRRAELELELGLIVLGGTSPYGKVDQTFAGGLTIPLADRWAIRAGTSLSMAPEYRDGQLGMTLLPAIELGLRRTGPLWVEPMVVVFFNDDALSVSLAGGARVGIHRSISETVGWTASVGGGVVTGHLESDVSAFGQVRVGLTHRL